MTFGGTFQSCIATIEWYIFLSVGENKIARSLSNDDGETEDEFIFYVGD